MPSLEKADDAYLVLQIVRQESQIDSGFQELAKTEPEGGSGCAAEPQRVSVSVGRNRCPLDEPRSTRILIDGPMLPTVLRSNSLGVPTVGQVPSRVNKTLVITKGVSD